MSNTNEIYAYIFNHLTTMSFGEQVYGDKDFCAALKKAIPLMMDVIRTRQRDDLNIKIAVEVGSKVLGDNVAKFKKEDERRLCFESALIMLNISRPESSDLLILARDEMLEQYPEFKSIDEEEFNLLISFRNMMVIAMQSICPKYNKNRLLDVVTRIVEGRNVKYITGSGQKDTTTRRVLIYQRESGIDPAPRPPRKGEIVKRRELSHAPLKRGRKKKMQTFISDSSKSRDAQIAIKRQPLLLDKPSPSLKPVREAPEVQVYTLDDLKSSSRGRPLRPVLLPAAPPQNIQHQFMPARVPTTSVSSSATTVATKYSSNSKSEPQTVPLKPLVPEPGHIIERQFSWASQVSTPDLDIFLSPFVDLYSSKPIPMKLSPPTTATAPTAAPPAAATTVAVAAFPTVESAAENCTSNNLGYQIPQRGQSADTITLLELLMDDNDNEPRELSQPNECCIYGSTMLKAF